MGKSIAIQFEGIYERDMDLLFMRKIATDQAFVRDYFLRDDLFSEKGYASSEFTVEKIAHSVTTEDGESDIEVVLSMEDKKIALLIENKIDAGAMPEQAARYSVRGRKAVERGDYEEFYVFIIAPKDYLSSNDEAKKYDHCISYEEIQENMEDEFEKSVIRHALSDSNNVRLPRSPIVTAFWNKLYDFIDKNYPGVFQIHGHKGLEKSGQAGQWITITCTKPYRLQIKIDRGYVDLEIQGYADRFSQFSNKNKDLIEEKRLYIRTATKSLAIRKYIEKIDFTQPFETQTSALTIAFDAAKELQNLIPKLILQ